MGIGPADVEPNNLDVVHFASGAICIQSQQESSNIFLKTLAERNLEDRCLFDFMVQFFHSPFSWPENLGQQIGHFINIPLLSLLTLFFQ